MKFKMTIMIMVAVIGTLAFSSGIVGAVPQASVYVDNEELSIDAPLLVSGVTMVPFREIFERYGMTVEWDNIAKKVTARNDQTEIIFAEGSMQAYINGEAKDLIQGPYVHDDILFVNLRFISEAIGAKVSFIKSSLSVYIELPKT